MVCGPRPMAPLGSQLTASQARALTGACPSVACSSPLSPFQCGRLECLRFPYSVAGSFVAWPRRPFSSLQCVELAWAGRREFGLELAVGLAGTWVAGSTTSKRGGGDTSKMINIALEMAAGVFAITVAAHRLVL